MMLDDSNVRAAEYATSAELSGAIANLPRPGTWPDGSCTLCVAFESPEHVPPYISAICSLFLGSGSEVRASMNSGRVRDDLSATEISARLELDLVERLELGVSLGPTEVELELARDVGRPATVELTLPISQGPQREYSWLQSAEESLSPIRALAIPVASDGLTPQALHAFVGLAIRTGGFVSADAQIFDVQALEWQIDRPEGEAMPLEALSNDATWAIGRDADSAVSWFKASQANFSRAQPDEGWWGAFDELLKSPSSSLSELRDHLSKVFRIPPALQVDDIGNLREVRDVVAPETDVIGRLVPTATNLVLAVDFQQPTKVCTDTLLHLCAHAELGHIQPGDDWGHWDTLDSVTSNSPYRNWDRDAAALVAEICRRPKIRKVSSIEECSPLEKAWLVLHGHIGKMVGEAQSLHPKAENYQVAAYQRQAAQRLVVQLEEYSGAMLCDGVGLGKTYVATTVMVHYANRWRDSLASANRSNEIDPFRITVLAPNSVVSTWQREAIADLGSHGVPLATVRVLSHTKLSRILSSSEILEGSNGQTSDMEHLLLSDLVVVDEAHNFRSGSASRTAILRDVLRLQPHKDITRKTLLLTATPVNNSLEDLRQQASLLFSKPLWFNDNIKPESYRARVRRDIEERMKKARSQSGRDVAAVLIHGSVDGKFSTGIDFRDDLQFGVQVPRVGDYLKEQEVLLLEQQNSVRSAMKNLGEKQRPVRIASEFLDRVVVQRSRNLCKQIEREQGSNVKLLFRPDAPPPEKLVYEDSYDDTRDVLAQFLPLFDSIEAAEAKSKTLSLKVYMWTHVRLGKRDASEMSPVVGLQRTMVLKRLESSPVVFLITLLRLLALHAHRLGQLMKMCEELGQSSRATKIRKEVGKALNRLEEKDRQRLDLLISGEDSDSDSGTLLARWSAAHRNARPAVDADDHVAAQLDLLKRDDETLEREEQLKRVWELKDDIESDFRTLLKVAPRLADIVFGRFKQDDWPRQFIAGGSGTDWPTSANWGLRIVSDAKLRCLVARLLIARRGDQKVIVFSQFTDTLAYIDSVFRATKFMDRKDWQIALRALTAEVGVDVSKESVEELTARTAVVSGETENRDVVINSFAPYYRIGPFRPVKPKNGLRLSGSNEDAWTVGWTQAIKEPVDILLASDVLAEGLNLQDASLLVNYDLHWNPVRMIQRAGRVDRRLNPMIEEAESFPDLEYLATKLERSAPRYWWHDHRDATPVTVNLLLSDELERELQLRERIASKTLAIDFTLGLEQGTGAEADWMSNYRYQGVSALNAWDQDRAIERVARYQERLRRRMSEREIQPDWLYNWNGWLRECTATEVSPIVAWAQLGRNGGDHAEYTRHLRPDAVGGVPHWLWTTAKSSESMLNFWLALDGKTFPADTRSDIGWTEDASRPLSADDLLGTAMRLVDNEIGIEELGPEIGRLVMQGASAISAGFLDTEADRRAIKVHAFRLLQLTTLELPGSVGTRNEGVKATNEDWKPARISGFADRPSSCGANVDGNSGVDSAVGTRYMHSEEGLRDATAQSTDHAHALVARGESLTESEKQC